jgi:CHAT domain-containing protein
VFYGENSNDYFEKLAEVGLFYGRNNQISKALSYYIQSMDGRTKYLIENIQNFNTFDKEFHKIKSVTNFNMFLDFSLNHLNNNRELVKAVYESWLNINGLITSNDQSLKFQINQSNDTNLINIFNEYSLKSMAYIKMIESGNNFPNEEIEDLKMNIVGLEKKLFFEISKTNLIPQYYSVMDVLSKVKDDEAFVDIIPFYSISNNNFKDPVFTKKYIAFILTSQTIDSLKFVIIENGNDLEDIQLREYAKSSNLEGGIENKDLDETSYNAFWAPIANQIKDKKKVFVSMGGVYNNINILTLYNLETSSYLIDEKDIQIINSGRSFVQSRTKPIPTYINNSAILIGFPNYNDSLTSTAFSNFVGYSRDLNPDILDSLTRGGFSLSNLPGTKIEIETIGKSLSINKWTVDVLTANQATETTLKNSHSPRVLHLATHGYFMNNQELKNEVNALFMGMGKENVVENSLLRSGLFFAGANQTLKGKVADNGDNGILTALEASFLDLKETELVVLSACETGRGEIENGEGVYGLRKAFADAGAQNIIMSLWKVDDKVTQEFMTTFYSNWLNDKSTIRVAFNKTQLEIKAKYPQPYYWGAFILMGE